MTTISQKLRLVSPSMTIEVASKAKEMIRNGEDVIDLSAGEPDFDTPEIIKSAAIASITAGKTKYTPTEGIKELRDAVIKKYNEKYKIGYTPNEVIISSGAKHSLFTLFFSLLDPGDEVIIPSPYWVSFPEMVKLSGASPVIIPCTEETQFKLSPASLARHITPKTKLMVINSPSNPSGEVYSKEELIALSKVIEKTNIFVISDEIYNEMIYDHDTFQNFITVLPQFKERMAVVGGVSKTYAMTGWRIGYTLAPAPIIEAMKTIQSHMTSNPSNPAQYAAVAALNSANHLVAGMIDEFSARRDLIVAGLNSIPGLSCRKPSGAFYVFPDVSTFLNRSFAGQAVVTTIDLCKFLLQDAKVASVPGEAFGSNTNIRISYAASRKALVEGAARIKKSLEKLNA